MEHNTYVIVSSPVFRVAEGERSFEVAMRVHWQSTQDLLLQTSKNVAVTHTSIFARVKENGESCTPAGHVVLQSGTQSDHVVLVPPTHSGARLGAAGSRSFESAHQKGRDDRGRVKRCTNGKTQLRRPLKSPACPGDSRNPAKAPVRAKPFSIPASSSSSSSSSSNDAATAPRRRARP